MTDLNAVKQFWETNPLWTGESTLEPGSFEFFEEHRKVYLEDCFAGSFDLRFLPPPGLMVKAKRFWTLDVGLVFGSVNWE